MLRDFPWNHEQESNDMGTTTAAETAGILERFGYQPGAIAAVVDSIEHEAGEESLDWANYGAPEALGRLRDDLVEAWLADDEGVGETVAGLVEAERRIVLGRLGYTTPAHLAMFGIES
ncbi:MAG: hypothetical protein U5K30_15155 [Acidimicrobiales bacterium]|nr:hypothetical protein [Acidimicrobiales bacterium]